MGTTILKPNLDRELSVVLECKLISLMAELGQLLMLRDVIKFITRQCCPKQPPTFITCRRGFT